jgi:hypothetical protein
MSSATTAEMVGFVVLIFLFTAATARYVSRESKQDNRFTDEDKQTELWWVIDDLEGNSRNWLDWGARLTKTPNSPFLNVHLRRCKEVHGADFKVVPLIGRDAVHSVLRSHGVTVPGEADIAPGWLWRTWASAHMVCYVGGLWVDSYVLFLRSIVPALGKEKAMRFGSDPDEELVGAKGGSVGSATNVLWAINDGCGLWKGYAQDLDKLMRGGPLSWNSGKIRRAIRYLQDKHLSQQVPVSRDAEWSRFSNGKLIQTDDLLERFIEGENELPPPTAFYVPLAPDYLNRSITNAWFLRLSEDQLLEAKFVWAHLASPQ